MMTEKASSSNSSIKDLLQLLHYANLAFLLEYFSYFIDYYFRILSLSINILSIINGRRIECTEIINKLKDVEDKQWRRIETTIPFKYPFSILMLCLFFLLLLSILPTFVGIFITTGISGSPLYEISVLLGVCTTSIIMYTMPWKVLDFIDLFVQLDLRSYDGSLTPNACLLRFVICRKHVNVFMYVIYFILLTTIIILPYFNHHIISQEMDNAIKSAFLIYIAYSNMWVKVSDIDVDTQQAFDMLFGSAIYSDSKK